MPNTTPKGLVALIVVLLTLVVAIGYLDSIEPTYPHECHTEQRIIPTGKTVTLLTMKECNGLPRPLRPLPKE